MCTCELTDIEICMCVFNSRIHPRAGERVRGGGACHPIWVSAWPYQVSVKHVLNTTPFPLITRVITWMLGDAQKSDWPHPPPPPPQRHTSKWTTLSYAAIDLFDFD